MAQWSVIPKLLKIIEKAGLSTLQSGGFAALAEQVESSLASPDRATMVDDELQFRQLHKQVSSRISDEARRAIADGAGEAWESYLLGQVSFAQLVVGRAVRKRADDRFAQRITHRNYERYVRALINQELSGREIAAAVNEKPETVSRKLQVLRQLGVVDCRKEGVRVMNFLTPAAKTYIRRKNIGSLPSTRSSANLAPDVRKAVEKATRGVPSYMMAPPVFDSSARRAA